MPKRTDIKAVYQAIASRAGQDERIAFSKRTFSAWMMGDGIAVSRPTIASLWYQIVSGPAVESYNEAREILTLDTKRVEMCAHTYTHTNGVYIHTTNGEYVIHEEAD